FLKHNLDSVSRQYWEGRNWRGARRLSYFANNFYRKGLLGRFIGVGHVLAKVYGANLKALTDCVSLDEQKQAFKTEIAPLFQKRAVRWLTDRRMSLYGLGIPPAQYEALAGGQKMSTVLEQRLEKLACGFPMQDNYFAWQAFGRGYAPDASGPLPPYLAEKNFKILKGLADRAEVVQGSVTDVLANALAGSVDRVVLLDAQDWMTDSQLNALWNAITHAAAPKARVIFRTAGVDTILPGRVRAVTLGQWHYLADQSRQLGAQDRSSIYGGFHIYEFNS
ncbi:MAG: DUF3419 family protein, partial [Alphaproteobacteria bacterium]|nr:DUF3419 family protein [Alphaproteobacteria bacterium]